MTPVQASRFGVYVHWPYCAAICPYCDFNVYRDRTGDHSDLVEAICADIAGWRAKVGPRTAETVFFGGGTPSRMAAGDVARIIAAVDAAFGLSDGAEISLEANPEDAAPGVFAEFAAAGVNRVSLGVQALEDGALKALGRAHTAKEGVAVVDQALAAFPSVSLDLIYAREGQSLAAWRSELEAALALGAPHLSLYQLTIEPGTAFEKRVQRGDLAVPGDDVSADFYGLTQDVCAQKGYGGYEISNHAKGAGHQSRHNRLYWESGDWAGVGPGAHGRFTLNDRRTATCAARRPAAYIAAASSGWGVVETESLTPEARGAEYLLMGLRLAEGVSAAGYYAVSGRRLDPETMTQLAADGLIVNTGDRLQVAPQARALTERIALELSA